VAFSSNVASISAGAPLNQVQVFIYDAWGRVLTADTSDITLGVDGSSADLAGSTTAAAIEGVATFNNTFFSAPGTFTLTASDTTDGFNAQSAVVVVTNPTGLTVAPGSQYAFTGTANNVTLDVASGIITLSQNLFLTNPSTALTVQSGAQVIIDSNQNVTDISLFGSGSLNVGTSQLFVNYGSNPDPIANITGYLRTGYNGGLWNGGAIFSSAAAANSGSYAIGCADSGDPGNPASLAVDTVEIRYTLLGDANLDGVVNGIDFGIVAANFNKGVSGWDQGDFNYDDVVNGVDFAMLAANFNKGAVTTDAAFVGAASNAPATVISRNVSTPSLSLSAPKPVIRHRRAIRTNNYIAISTRVVSADAGSALVAVIAARELVFRYALRNHNLANRKDTPDRS
jgi:hypothetical protein